MWPEPLLPPPLTHPHPFADVFDDEDGHSLCDCPDPCACDYPDYSYYAYQPPYYYEAYPRYDTAPSSSAAPARPPPLSRGGHSPSPTHSASPPTHSAHPIARASRHHEPRGTRLDERDAPKPMRVRHFSTGSIGREVTLVRELRELHKRQRDDARGANGHGHPHGHGNGNSNSNSHSNGSGNGTGHSRAKREEPREREREREEPRGNSSSTSNGKRPHSRHNSVSSVTSTSSNTSATIRSITPAPRAPSPSKRVTFAEPPKPERPRKTSKTAASTPNPPSILRNSTAMRYAACPLAAGVPLTDLRSFPTTPGALNAQSAVLASLLRDLRALRSWEGWCAELGDKLATHKLEEGRLRGALDGVVPLHHLREWGEWVEGQLASSKPVVSRDHLREEKEFVAFLAGLAGEVANAADLRARCEAEIARLRRTRR